jgi:large repetitive protein
MHFVVVRDEVGTKMEISVPSSRLLNETLCSRSAIRRRLFILTVMSAVIFFPILGLAGGNDGTFSYIGEMTVPRSYHTATLLTNGKVLIAGGRRSVREELDSAELYDPSLHKFVPTGKMLSARAGHTATMLPDGKVLIAGGFQPGDSLASAELYDPVSGTFSVTGSMTEPRQWHTATLLSDGKVLITGRGNMTGIRPTAELYDPATGKFSATGEMTVARMEHYAAALNGGNVLIVGGVRGGGPNYFFSGHNFLASAELYDPGQARFTSLSGTDEKNRANGSAVLLSNREVLIAGGVDADVIVGNARLYDPAEHKFLLAPSMTSERAADQTTLLSNGQVLVTGGVKGFDWGPVVVATTELYDPELGVFTRLPDMTTPRAGQTATLLRSGEVLIAGGRRGSFISLSSAELFRPAPIVKRASGKTPVSQSLN